ncbi:stage II sporulation protein P [Tepidibacillus marianensis]|uniref:stage II sporulation protein P n=1 Tax=Tepidibacillus marianensis TaxID=3131995 RepID=UPI0030D3F667
MRQPSIQKFFLSLSVGTAMIFLIISGVFLQIANKPATSNNFLDKLALKFSTNQLLHLFTMEIPIFHTDVQALKDVNSQENENPFLNLFFLTYTPKNPNDWIKEEIPVYSLMDMDKLTAANMTDVMDHPIESEVPKEFMQADTSQDNAKEALANKNVVFIYHTHNREAFLPETKTNSDAKKNVTLVGKQLGAELKKLGVGAEVSTDDYYADLEKYTLAYKESFKTVKEAVQQNKNYQFIFDIHRDGYPSGKTYDSKDMKKLSTITIKGKSYAAISFVIGKGNQNYEKNKEFAQKLHNTINNLYPGLSKKITEKTKTSGTNGEYNQSVSPNSVLIEIGSNYNTLQEEYNTAKALAEVVAEIYFDAEKVNATPQPKQN